MTGDEYGMVEDAIASNWVAPLGPHVDAFEAEFAQQVEVPHAAALSSGTAAIHLALRLIGLESGDEVLCPTLTFVATANPILYEGGRPVFLDVDPETWTLDPNLLAGELQTAARRGRLPRAVITVDLYGQSADHDPILELCSRYEIPVIEDAAEALGATYKGRSVGGFGRFGVFSFNGNKIITTSGGGMLVAPDEADVAQARFLATQARDPAIHYQHSTVGYNYRMSNVVAAIGRAQLGNLEGRVAARRRNFARYQELLGDLAGLEFMDEAPYGRCTRWLTCLTIDPAVAGTTAGDVCRQLEVADIEARPVWKPMHLQPLFAAQRTVGGDAAASLFDNGLCLPSGSNLKEEELEEVASLVRGAWPA
jgi:pyridoxal phosphate-dependent aminotransferase EpsN